jgi:hypothetical protein
MKGAARKFRFELIFGKRRMLFFVFLGKVGFYFSGFFRKNRAVRANGRQQQQRKSGRGNK